MEDLELRELFDPEDLIDRFVFLLAETVADLAHMDAIFHGTLEDGNPPTYRFYMQRQVAARIVEAWRPIAAFRDMPVVREFVARAGGLEAAEWLRENLTRGPKGGETRIEKTFRADRHRTIHFAKIMDKALTETLTKAADEVVKIAVYRGGDKPGSEIIEFPEAAINRAIFGDPDQPEVFERRLRERATLIQEAHSNFVSLWQAILPAQVERKGIDPKRVYEFRHRAPHNVGLPQLLRRVASWLERLR
jgi:hypothetical protein